jgi:hypothetical protein
VEPSSQNLHPTHGGRFVLERTCEAPVTYAVIVYLPEGEKVESVLSWNEQGAPTLDPPFSSAWVHDETVKLARVLKRTPKTHLSRWRG